VVAGYWLLERLRVLLLEQRAGALLVLVLTSRGRFGLQNLALGSPVVNDHFPVPYGATGAAA
jgi:hypothetical protein